MVIPKINSAHGSDTRNLINRAIEVINRLGIDVQTLVANGQLTPSQYAELLSVVNNNLKSGDVSLNDLSPDVLEAINNGGGALFEILSIPRDKSVDPGKTTFFDLGENIFDGHYHDGMITYDTPNGRLVYWDNSVYPQYGGGKFAAIPIEPYTHYSVRVNESMSSDAFRIGIHSGIPSTNNTIINRVVLVSNTSQKEHGFVTENESGYALIYVSNNAEEPSMTITKGAKINRAFIPEISNGSITPELTTFFDLGENIFDGNYYDGMITYDAPNGRLVYWGDNHPNYTNFDGKFAAVEILEGRNYEIIVEEATTSNAFRVGIHNSIPSAEGTALDIMLHGTSTNDKRLSFVAPQSGYLIVFPSNDGQEPEMSIKTGFGIPERFLKIEKENRPNTEFNNKDPRFNFSGDFNSFYEHPNINDLVPGIGDIKTNAVNDLFLNLVAQHSDIGVATKLGSDEVGDIYKVESKPAVYNDMVYNGYPLPDDGTPLKIPKIIITAGVHGSEKSPPVSLYYFLKTLWENPENDPEIESLAQNVHFITVPVVGPRGYNDNTYDNNGVNLNRDFAVDGTPEGAATVITRNLLDEHSDADYVIDFHNMFTRDGLLGYVITNNELWQRIGTNIYKNIGARWSKKESGVPTSRDHKFALSATSPTGTIVSYVEEKYGISSGLLEVPRRNPFNTNVPEYNEFIIRLGVDILTNGIYSAIRNKQ